jgi:hypothetical protein
MALNKSCTGPSALSIIQADYNFIYTIQKLIKDLPIDLTTKHIKGHQDDSIPYDQLDRWSLLNIKQKGQVHSSSVVRGPKSIYRLRTMVHLT